ncbi:hypothetical protein GWK47_007813 [Chionoecetes opilio]|uniref:Uncharacterized protein n=1 Tax=Chionoecetes opilio TaxID=41210 RepID=A0A8J4XZX8_CHIOP|nr:hypothetical protein GWK47_007813 [Chionoecetes opilio]
MSFLAPWAHQVAPRVGCHIHHHFCYVHLALLGCLTQLCPDNLQAGRFMSLAAAATWLFGAPEDDVLSGAILGKGTVTRTLGKSFRIFGQCPPRGPMTCRRLPGGTARNIFTSLPSMTAAPHRPLRLLYAEL